MSNDEKSVSPVNQIIGWASGQPFNNVLLLAILGAVGWLGYWAITIAVPMHLRQIQDGYEKLEDRHREERSHTLETYNRWLDARKSGVASAIPAIEENRTTP